MEENKKSRLPVILVAVFVLLLVALYVYLYLIPEISGSMTETSVVSYARIQAQAKSKCILAREEGVTTSGGRGTVSYYVEEGAKTRKGTKVADVYSGGNKKSLTASSTGIISYYLDGYEDYFNPVSFAELSADEVAALDDIKPDEGKPASVDSNEPLFKQINANELYVIVIADISQKDVYNIGQSLTVEFDKDNSVPAEVIRINEGEKHMLVFAQVERYYEGFARQRTVTANIISSTTEGLLVPTAAITTNGENYGVLVLDTNGDYVFRSITILIEGPEETLIADGGAVKLYDEVLKDARDYQQ